MASYSWPRQYVEFARRRMNVATSKLKEQSGNVYENKGPLWKTLAYPGMYVKINDLSAL
jgi:hypothetical protein